MPFDAAAVARKLKLGAATSPAVVDAPPGDREALAASRGSPIPDRLGAGHDWILLYARDRAGLEAALPAASRALASPGKLRIAYPKGSSKVQTDMTRDGGWESVRNEDLMWLTLVSIDDTWSAFSLRHHKPGEARQTFR